MTAFSFNVGRLKFHIACPRYSAGGALKIAGSNWLAAFWADTPTARRTMEIANRNIWVHLFSFEPGRAATVQDFTLVLTAVAWAFRFGWGMLWLGLCSPASAHLVYSV